MLAGLKDLTQSELEAFAKEAQTYREGQSQEAVLDALMAWMASRAGAKGVPPTEMERAVLSWLAQRLGLMIAADTSTDDIEAQVRRKIAEDSYEFLFPFLAVGSAVAYLGPAQVIGPKLELLEASAAALIPSHSARQKMRDYWVQRGSVLQADKQVTAGELMDYFRETVDLLAEMGLPTRISILVLNHVVALSDGRYEQSEDLFMQLLGDALKVDRAEAERVKRDVSEAFWKQLTALGGGTYQSQGRQTEEELAINMQAAQRTLDATRGLASFSAEVEHGFVASMRRSLSLDQKVGALGLATGMMCYIKDRLRAGDHEILMRLALAAIFRQHLEATGDHARVTTERIEGYLPHHKVENVADTLAETAVGEPVTHAEVKKISLDPKFY